jgi:hypothetical protein
MGYDEHLGRCSGLPVVRDLEATASGVRSATPKEALDSGRVHRDRGKVGDLTGASGAYVLGLLGYEVGAAATVALSGSRTRLWACDLRFLGRAFVLVDQSSQYRSASDPPVAKIRSGKIRAWWLKL